MSINTSCHGSQYYVNQVDLFLKVVIYNSFVHDVYNYHFRVTVVVHWSSQTLTTYPLRLEWFLLALHSAAKLGGLQHSPGLHLSKAGLSL